MKLLLTAIFKGDSEIEQITRMLKSFMPYFQGLAVAITGQEPSEKLEALIKFYKGQFVKTTPQTHPKLYVKDGDKYIFGNFAEARNVSFELASKMQEKEQFDWWSWADCDDILLNGLELEAVAKKALEFKVDLVFFTYWYSINIKNGTFTEQDVQIDHLRERLIKPNMFKWVSRVHEVALPIDGNYQAKNTSYDFNMKEGRGLVWAHLTDSERSHNSMERNIKILEAQIKEEERKDPRTVFYLAKTYFDVAKFNNKPEYFQLADMLIDEYIPKSGWAEERANAWQYKGDIRSIWGKHREAIDCYHKSLAEYGNRHMPYLLLAKEYAEVNDDEMSQFWLSMAMKMEEPQARTTIGNPLEVKFLAASLKYNEALKKNDIKGAIEWLKIRNQISGHPEEAQLKTLEELNLRNDAAMWIFNYAKWLKETGHSDKIEKVVESLPLELGREVFAHIMANEYVKPRKWAKNEIAYYASFGMEHFEQWSGNSLSKGIGGSETAVIELARRWVAKGFKVTIYGDPREDEGEIDGVIYKPWYAINWNDEFNVLILWRSPHLLDRPIKARKLFYDAHDVESQLNWPKERIDKIDKIFVKSIYHRQQLPNVPDLKIKVISNGI